MYLVKIMAYKLINLDNQIRVAADLPSGFGFARSPKIFRFIPDVYGHHRVTGYKYICEAKTYNDLETERSQEQIRELIAYVNHIQKGIFTLGGLGETATRAKTMLRFLVKENKFAKDTVQVFDGLDYWKLESEEEPIWHLC